MSAIGSGRAVPALLLFAALLWGLAGCQTSPPQPPPAPAAAGAGSRRRARIPAGAHEYKVVAEESLLQILVYRGGAMARLGHNHVIASHQLSGSVYLTDDPLATRFDISFPVNELTVDEPALREAAGPDFPPGVPQSARDGTHANLLSDGAARRRALSGDPPARHRHAAPPPAASRPASKSPSRTRPTWCGCRVKVERARRRRDRHAASFRSSNRNSGLKPFSIAMGALRGARRDAASALR